MTLCWSWRRRCTCCRRDGRGGSFPYSSDIIMVTNIGLSICWNHIVQHSCPCHTSYRFHGLINNMFIGFQCVFSRTKMFWKDKTYIVKLGWKLSLGTPLKWNKTIPVWRFNLFTVANPQAAASSANAKDFDTVYDEDDDDEFVEIVLISCFVFGLLFFRFALVFFSVVLWFVS